MKQLRLLLPLSRYGAVAKACVNQQLGGQFAALLAASSQRHCIALMSAPPFLVAKGLQHID